MPRHPVRTVHGRRTVLAPTDLLLTNANLGIDAKYEHREPHNLLLLDPVEQFYPWLDFAGTEWRAGRMPLWNPYAYGGSPLAANNQSAVYSPFSAVFYLWPSPRSLVWIQLLKSLVAAVGTYGFLRATGQSEWASMIAGWCFPLCGLLSTLLFHPHSAAAVWLPCGFWAAESVVTRPRGRGGFAGAVVVGLLLVSGHLETASHVLLAIGFYGAWRCVEHWAEGLRQRALRAAFTGVVASGVGFGLGAVQMLPTIEYVESSLRLQRRREGQLDSPPAAGEVPIELARSVFPRLFGTWESKSCYLAPTSADSGNMAFVGFVMMMMAPLGFARGSRRSPSWCLVLLALLAAAPAFRIPVLSLWEQLPPLQLLLNHRAIIVTAWCCVVLGARGIDSLAERERPPTAWTIGAGSVALVCCLAFFVLVVALPKTLAQAMPPHAAGWFRDQFTRSTIVTGACVVLIVAGLALRSHGAVLRVAWGIAAIGELLLLNFGYHPQSDPDTFYPDRPIVEFLRQRAGSGRILFHPSVVSANIATRYGLRDVRGYDGVDPAATIELLNCANPKWMPDVSHGAASSFWSLPSPVVDLLSVRFIVTRSSIDTTWPRVASIDGLRVYANPNPLERAFVPHDVRQVTSSDERLRLLSDPAFDPRELAIVEEQPSYAAFGASGTVRIEQDLPCRVSLDVSTDSDAVVVLADSWAPGWQVRVDGRPARLLRVNHALRGVEVSAGHHMIEWIYWPASVARGLWLAVAAAIALTLWCAIARPWRASIATDAAHVELRTE